MEPELEELAGVAPGESGAERDEEGELEEFNRAFLLQEESDEEVETGPEEKADMKTDHAGDKADRADGTGHERFGPGKDPDGAGDNRDHQEEGCRVYDLSGKKVDNRMALRWSAVGFVPDILHVGTFAQQFWEEGHPNQDREDLKPIFLANTAPGGPDGGPEHNEAAVTFERP